MNNSVITARRVEAALFAVRGLGVAGLVTVGAILMRDGGSVPSSALPFLGSAYLVAAILLVMRPKTGSIDFAVTAVKASFAVLGAGLLIGALVELTAPDRSLLIVVEYALLGALSVYVAGAERTANWFRARCRRSKQRWEERFGSEEDNEPP